MTTADDTDDDVDRKATLGAILGALTDDDFAELARRTGHTEPDPKEEAARALAERVRHGNLVPEGATTGDVLAALRRRHGKGWGK